ncbi:MAG: Gfo/Idh/MocA family oxidoreductase [Verrucomicrobiota bacterium]|jgi:predicted dehydrogenase
MNTFPDSTSSRREFLKTTGKVAAASALAGVALPRVHAASGDTIQIAFIGNGGRGTGAVANALATRKQGPIKLVAMADVFQARQASSYSELSRNYADQVDVPPDRRFLGFDAYKKAMDCLKPGDVVILTTPLAFRWVHFTYAIEKGLNVFMEKPLTADGPTSTRMIKLAEQATAKNLKCGVGLMSRHSRALQELAKRVQDGEIGDIVLMRGYRMHGPVGYFSSLPKPPGISEMLYQVQRFHSFLWAGGGNYSDFYIHIVDHLCWLKNAWPVKAQGVGGRHYKTSPEGAPYVDQNFDSYSVEYTFADGTKFLMDGRCMTGCSDIYASYLHGTKGVAVASHDGDCGMPSSTYKGLNVSSANRLWVSKVAPAEADPYQNEWNELIDAIRNDKPYNEVKRGVEASLATSMGRMAVHSGQEITWDDMLNSAEYAPGLDKLNEDSPAPVPADANGDHAKPMPGKKGKREY